jgi:hypothetical protein
MPMLQNGDVFVYSSGAIGRLTGQQGFADAVYKITTSSC